MFLELVLSKMERTSEIRANTSGYNINARKRLITNRLYLVLVFMFGVVPTMAQVTSPSSDALPLINLRPSCEIKAADKSDEKTTHESKELFYQLCVEMETYDRLVLSKSWRSIPVEARTACQFNALTPLPQFGLTEYTAPSYSSLKSCIAGSIGEKLIEGWAGMPGYTIEAAKRFGIGN